MRVDAGGRHQRPRAPPYTCQEQIRSGACILRFIRQADGPRSEALQCWIYYLFQFEGAIDGATIVLAGRGANVVFAGLRSFCAGSIACFSPSVAMTSLQRQPLCSVIRSAARCDGLALAVVIAVYAATGPAAAEEACKLEGDRAESFPAENRGAPANLRPMAKPGEPLPDDCGFYKWAWQAFLYETQATRAGQAAFLSASRPSRTCLKIEGIAALRPINRPNLLSLAPRSSKVSNKDESKSFPHE